jgi:hypothetical protein
VSVASIAGAFWGTGSHPAPKDAGVCWRMHMRGETPRFDRLAGDILNLETCAAHLERIHLMRGGEVAGAYQGRFIFIDSQAIRSASSLEGSRWRVFFDPQRAALDQKLREGGSAPRVALMPAS